MPTSEQAAKLIAAVRVLGTSIDTLADRFDVQEAEIERQKRLITQGKRRDRILAVSVLLDIVLTIWLSFANVSLGHIQTTQQADTARNETAQCAFMAVFFQIEPNLAKSPNYSEEQKANQVLLFSSMHKIARDLGCKEK